VVIELTFTEFCDALEKAGRGDYFSYEGKQALYNHLENQDPDYKFDAVEIVSTYTEESAEEIIEKYNLRYDKELDNPREIVQRFFEKTGVNLIAETGYGFLYEDTEID